MIDFARLSPAEREPYFIQTAAHRGMHPLIVEKDFWVCFILKLLFSHSDLSNRFVFKGGTSLSKVYGIIERFSEDVDLSLDPEWLGFGGERNPDLIHSRSGVEKSFARLQQACEQMVQNQTRSLLEAALSAVLGPPPRDDSFLEYQLDMRTHSPLLMFHYPKKESPVAVAGIRPQVKLEFGSLTDQQPKGSHFVTPWVAGEFPDTFHETRAQVTALEAERSFWEKATILHAEYHRPEGKSLRERFSRDCYDVFAMAKHPEGTKAIGNLGLLDRVAQYKERYFRTSWANYKAARPGTLRLVPPDSRLAEIKADYDKMKEMFYSTPPLLEEILDGLRDLENKINQ